MLPHCGSVAALFDVQNASLSVHRLAASSSVRSIVPIENCLDTQREALTEDQLGQSRPGGDGVCDPGAVEVSQ